MLVENINAIGGADTTVTVNGNPPTVGLVSGCTIVPGNALILYFTNGVFTCP